ncbi:MAG: aminopeptidase P family protein [Deltaproteobacteria bacterium]|nr:aminopeptidase P family protein [Deltaproteobacteria bacterium]
MLEPIKRIKTLQEMIETRDLSGVILFYSRDVFYYTGTSQPSYFFISPQHYCLFVRAGYDFALREAQIEKENIKEERHLENIFKENFSIIKRGKKIGVELDVLPANRFLEFSRIFSGFEIVDISPLLLNQRKRKDASEIKIIRKACSTIHRGHERVLTVLREGLTELELAAAVEDAHRLAGHEGIFFIRQPDFFMSRGPLASGPNLYQISGMVYSITGVGLSASVPLGPSRRKIRRGDLVVVDIPVLVEGYHADQTRTYVVGKAKDGAKKLFQSLKEISNHLIDHITPGMKCSEVYKMAVKKAEELQVGKPFLNFGNGRKSKIIGHGVGIEINEPPTLSDYDHSIISEGFVLALDMHMMDEKFGVVKLEDMIVIGEKNKLLTKTPRELFEVE